MAHVSMVRIRSIAALAGFAASLYACAAQPPLPPEGAVAERPVPGQLPPAVFTGELGQLQVFITSQMTDGRNVLLRGLVKNPYPETVTGVRVVARIFHETSPNGRELDRFQKTMDIELAQGEQKALRWDIQSMYAGDSWVVIEAYAVKLGSEKIPAPADWRE